MISNSTAKIDYTKYTSDAIRIIEAHTEGELQSSSDCPKTGNTMIERKHLPSKSTTII